MTPCTCGWTECKRFPFEGGGGGGPGPLCVIHTTIPPNPPECSPPKFNPRYSTANGCSTPIGGFQNAFSAKNVCVRSSHNIMPEEFKSYIYVLTNKYFVSTVSVKQSCQKTLESIFIAINGMLVANLTNLENLLLVLVSWLKATGLISGMS